MEILLAGIPLDEVSTSMTIDSPAAVIWAMYIAAEKQGVHPNQLRGTIQNDILKEYIAQKEYIFPPEPSMRLVTDIVEYGTIRSHSGIRFRFQATISEKLVQPPLKNWPSPWLTV